MTGNATPITGERWMAANAAYLSVEMARIRLLLRRRILWLRKQWKKEASGEYSGWAISDQEAFALLDGNNAQEEEAFYQTDPDAREITIALAETSQQLSGLRQEMQEEGMAAAIDTVAERFGLTSFERGVLLLCLAPELDPSFERLYAYLQDDSTRRYVTPHFAMTLLAHGETNALARASFLPAAPLRRFSLITVDANPSSAAFSGSILRVDEGLANHILGMNQLDERCRNIARFTGRIAVPSPHQELVARLAQWLDSGKNRRPKLINLIGPEDSGRQAVAHAICERLGLTLVVLDSPSLPAGSDRRILINVLDRESILLGLVFFLEVEALKPDDVQSFRADLDRGTAPMIIASAERIQSTREMIAAQIVRPDAAAQVQLWRQTLGESAGAVNGHVEAIAEQFDFGPDSIANATVLAHNHAALRSPGSNDICGEDLWQACRQQAGPQLDQLAQKVTPCYDWDDIVVPPEVLRQLREITSQVAHRPAVYQGWGFGKKLSRGRGISALFAGPSGVGKTMAAEVMAQHLNLDLYRIDLAGVVSKYIGETEKNLRRVFDAAERSGAILFFDEADALFGKRSEVKDSHDRYANIEVNYLLQRMEDYRGLAILATNMKSFLDTAFMRRLRFIVDFPFPDGAQRMEIWQRVFPATADVRGLDYQVLSRLEIPGGNIRNIAVNAAFLAVSEGTAIGMNHVMQAARREYTKIDRLIMDAEFGRYSEARVH
jgi:hypothetical protein